MAIDTDRSLASLLTDIVGNVQQIVRAEVRLAKVEVQQEVAKARTGAMLVAAGGLVVALALGVLLLAAVYALALVWPAWAAALAVGLAAAGLGAAVAAVGMNRFKSITLAPPRSAAILEENIQWAKTRAR
jgi:uncharacterized membrane protein YqjE